MRTPLYENIEGGLRTASISMLMLCSIIFVVCLFLKKDAEARATNALISYLFFSVVAFVVSTLMWMQRIEDKFSPNPPPPNQSTEIK